MNNEHIKMRRAENKQKKDRDDAKKDRTKKIHGKTMPMLEMLAGEDCDNKDAEMPHSVQAFLNSENEANA